MIFITANTSTKKIKFKPSVCKDRSEKTYIYPPGYQRSGFACYEKASRNKREDSLNHR